MSDNRPPIKESIKREVRQRCGFGCVLCGVPVYHYDHMDEYNVVQEHTADNITLLCGSHHDLKTRGQLPTAVVRSHNANPHNKPHGKTSAHLLFYYGAAARIVAGGNEIFVANKSVSALKIDGHSLVDFELVDGNLMLNIDLRDAAGEPVLTVHRNELVHSTHLWDYRYTGKRLSINEAERRIYLTISFEPETHRVVLENGLVSHNGVDVLIDPNGLCILNNCTLLSGSNVVGTGTAIYIGDAEENQGGSAFHIEISRNAYDQKSAIAWARKEMRQVGRQHPAPPADSHHHPLANFGLRAKWMSIFMAPYPWTEFSCGRRS